MYLRVCDIMSVCICMCVFMCVCVCVCAQDASLINVSPDMRLNVMGRWASKEEEIGEVQW